MSGKVLDMEFKEIQDEEKELETDIGGKDIESEWKEIQDEEKFMEIDKTSVGEKEFKEIQDEDNLMETDIGGENLDYALKEIDDALQKPDNDMAEKGIEKQLKTTSEVSRNIEGDNKRVEEKGEVMSMGMENSMEEKTEKKQKRHWCERYKYKVRRNGRLTNKAFSRFTNTSDDPICLETDEKIKVGESKKKRNTIEKTTKEKGNKRTRELSEKKERLGKINVEKHKIKIDCANIHQLLGVPCGKIVSNIENAKSEDCFNFRMDFLMCFLAVMVECHGQGRCKEKILDKLTGETDFSNINWCAYIIDSMRGCKERWKRNYRSVPFSGPLTILTV
ncbi:hypothetical protein L1987_58232 [Smallanthus sonchifolius]|uniref:Uncharacterized protein n=1 Tax=Smallanthus sonchifolius TaxID=185202 RepID=A0ACB9DF68_9ASTR|nr:hypothetical protein L1987_58232 [Smallanthus sonchifolius]